MNRLLWILVFTLSLNVYSNTIPPSLSNFVIKKDQPSRVYFDSSKNITATNTKGFIIGSRSISGVKIISGKTTGHYFTVSKPFTFWDNDLIRYEGGSNLQDIDKNPLDVFTLQYIHNNIPEPSGNGNVYYVSDTGNDKNNGLSQNNAWRTISSAATKAKAGDIVYIKAGDYGRENVVIKNSGSKSKPIKFIGYKTTIGDVEVSQRSVGMQFDSKKMPLLKNGNGTAISCKKKSFVIIRNIQIESYSQYGINFDSASFLILDNVYVQKTKWAIRTIDANSTNNRIINSYVANSSQTGIEVMNKNNLIDNTWAVSSYRSSMDYYLIIRGGKEGTNNIIRNSYVNRFINDSHSGHGISLKADQHMNGYSLEYNLVENCQIIGTKLELRHRPVRYNVFRNCEINGDKGISINDGASFNILENITIKNAEYFVNWKETIENGGMNENGHHNIIRNSIGYNLKTLFTVGTYESKQEKLIKNNSFLNCTFYNIEEVYSESIVIDNTNKITNCIFSSVKKAGNTKFNATETYNNYYNGFKKPNGTGNKNANPNFKNASRGDFRLEAKSLLKNAGKRIVDVKSDFDGLSRPQGSSHDIGAFEYNEEGGNSKVLNADAGEDIELCKGESAILKASGGSSYEWSTGETTQSISVSPLSTKSYSVIVKDGNSSDIDEVTVSVIELTAHAGANRVIEIGESTKLRGAGGDAYKWSTGETTKNITVSPKINTRYTLIVYKNGCEAEDSVKITVNQSEPDAIVASAGEDLEICKGESAVLTASGGSSYKWNTGETTKSITVSPSKPEIYEVTVYEGDRSGVDDVLVDVISVSPDAGSDRTIEIGNSTKLTASGGDTYLWSTGEKSKSITVSPEKTQNYTVTVYKNGCSKTDNVKVTVIDAIISNPAPMEAFAGDDISICLGETVALNASGGETYSWSTGDHQEDIKVNPSRTTTYTLRATNGSVTTTDSVVVTVENCNISTVNDQLENVFDIYPNPASGTLNLDIRGSEKDLNLILVSTNGSVVYKDIISAKNAAVTKQVDLSRFAKGMYFVRLFNDEENLVQKLLII